MKLVYPTLVPIKLLTILARAGLHTTKDVHTYIKNGKLRTLKGIGAKTEAKILRYYTEN